MQKSIGEKMMNIDYSTSDPDSQEFKIKKAFADAMDRAIEADRGKGSPLLIAIMKQLNLLAKQVLSVVRETAADTSAPKGANQAVTCI